MILHIQISLCIEFHFEQTILNLWTKFSQEGCLCSKTEKVNIIIEFRIFQISLGTKFRLKLTILIFLTRFSQKGFSGLKQKKWTPHIFYIILHTHINLVWNFNSNWKFWVFEPNLPTKIFPVENRKSEHHHGNVHIGISQGTKFQPKLIILSFWTKLAQKKVFRVENRISNPTTRSLCFLCSKRAVYCTQKRALRVW